MRKIIFFMAVIVLFSYYGFNSNVYQASFGPYPYNLVKADNIEYNPITKKFGMKEPIVFKKGVSYGFFASQPFYSGGKKTVINDFSSYYVDVLLYVEKTPNIESEWFSLSNVYDYFAEPVMATCDFGRVDRDMFFQILDFGITSETADIPKFFTVRDTSAQFDGLHAPTPNGVYIDERDPLNFYTDVDDPVDLNLLIDQCIAYDTFQGLDVEFAGFTEDNYSSNKHKLGTHRVEFSHKTERGNSSNTVVYITVLDIAEPVISGPAEIEILMSRKHEFSEESILNEFSCLDNYDGDLTGEITLTKPGVLDLETPALTTWLLSVSDSSDNTTELSVGIRVVDDVAPVINATNLIMNHFYYPGAFQEYFKTIVASDNVTVAPNVEMSISDFVSVSGSIPGIYGLVITATDEAGNIARKNVVIELRINHHPVYFLDPKLLIPGQILTDTLLKQITGILEEQTGIVSSVSILNETVSDDGSISVDFSYKLNGEMYIESMTFSQNPADNKKAPEQWWIIPVVLGVGSLGYLALRFGSNFLRRRRIKAV